MAQAIDEVARNKMWVETINKENSLIGKPHQFFLNPSKLVFIARKPTELDPRKYEDEREVMEEKMKQLAKSVAARKAENEMCPQWMYERESDGWGTFVKPCPPEEQNDCTGEVKLDMSLSKMFQSTKSSWYAPKGSSDVTAYAEHYYSMARVSPFARKDALAKGGGG